MSLPNHLRLLSYNIQSGLSTTRYSDYLTRSWRHVVPVPSRMENLDAIATLIADYDIVGLQEIDSGSLRSGFLNQVKYLADRAGFAYVYDQANRRIGVISQHCNAMLSRCVPNKIAEHKLPGLIPGRGALHVSFGQSPSTLDIFILHLALGPRGRRQQIRYLATLIRRYPHVVVMGDLNCRSESREMALLLALADLREPHPNLYTFPSWRPTRQLDHILVSPSIEVVRAQALPYQYSDHLPLEVEIVVPEAVRAAAEAEA